MAICIHKLTKQVVSLDTVAASTSGDYVVYHKRQLPDALVRFPSKYWVLDADQFRVATAAERAQIDAAEAAAVRSAQIQQIKERARAEILQRFPEWRQANMTARAVELLESLVSGKPWTESQVAEVNLIREAWSWIKDRRAQSDAEESKLLSSGGG